MSVILERKVISYGNSICVTIPPEMKYRKKITIIVLSIEEEKKIKRNKLETIKNILGENDGL